MLRTLLALSTSIIGESPVTVIVSCRALSCIVMSTWKVDPVRIRIPSRRKVAKPVSSAVTVKVPGGRLMSRYSPFSLVTPVCGPSISGAVAVTVTPGSAPPCPSMTSPAQPAEAALRRRDDGPPRVTGRPQ